MVLYHLVFDLDRFGGCDLDATSGFGGAFATVDALLFIVLVGVSLWLQSGR